MGANILLPQNSQFNDRLFSHNQSQYPINLNNPFDSQNNSNFVNYISKDFHFNQDSLTVLSREEIVENNFSEQFDPLFTTFRPQKKNTYGKFRILCSNITNQKIQEYKIFFKDEKDFRTYLISYFWRKSHCELKNWPLVRTTNLRVYDQSKRALQGGISGLIRSKCSSNKEIYCRVYIEDIPLRLCHIKDIPYPQNLYVMTQVLKGFQLIYESIGYIKPFEDLICVTRKGLIKVWINSDLSKNFPNIEHIDDNLTSSMSESKLVNEIIDIVVNNTDPSQEPMSFYAFLRQQHVNLQFISFQKALQMISKYEIQFNTQIPDVFASIVELLNQEEEQYDTYRTDIEHGNEQKVQSSQPIRSQNRSGSGFLLDVPNSTSHLRLNHKSKLSSKKQSSRNLQKKHKNKTQKTQSLKIGQHDRQSLQQSMSGAKSNIILSQSLPITRSMNQQKRSNNINMSRKSKNKSPRRQQSRSRTQQQCEGDLVQIQRQSERSNESVLAMRQSKGPQEDQKEMGWIKEAVVRGQVLMINQSNKMIGQGSGYQGQIDVNNAKNVHNHLQYQLNSNQLSSLTRIPHISPHLSQNQPKKLSNQSHNQHPDLWADIHSNNELLNSSRNPSQFLKNKKTYSNFDIDRKYSDRVLLNGVEIQPSENDTIEMRVEATEEEMKQMIQIDRFIEAEVQREEEEKLRLSEMHPSTNQFLNKSQEFFNSSQKLINDSFHPVNMSQHLVKPIHHSLNKSQELPGQSPIGNQRGQRLNNTIIPVPLVLNRNSSSRLSSKQQELSVPQMQTSRQKRLSNESGLYNEMHASHHLPHMDRQVQQDQVLNSHIVQRPVWSNGQLLNGGSNLTKFHERQRLQAAGSPHSRGSINYQPSQQLLLQQSNTHIEIQPPSSSSRANHIQNAMTNIKDIQKLSQNNLPHVMVLTSSNQVIVPISQHQLMVNSMHRQQPSVLASSTSIGYSIAGPTVKQVHFQSNTNTVVSSQLQKEGHRVPKVTFNNKSQQKFPYANVDSSKKVSVQQLNFSQKQIMNQSNYPGKLQLALSNPGQPQCDQNVNRLSYRAQTMVSAYMYSQGGNTSSRKYYELEESSSYSKPSIVEYSYLRNPEYFGNGQGVNNGESHNFHIHERSVQYSLQKIPVMSADLIQCQQNSCKDQKKFSIPQINYHCSYNPVQYEPHMIEIVPIPEQTQAQIFNNSRSLVNNDEWSGIKQNQNSFVDNYYKNNDQSGNQIDMVSSKHQSNPNQHHKRQPSGVKMVESQKDDTPYQVQNQIQKHRKQSYFISQEFSHGAEDPIRSESSKFHGQFKINIRPSFESMSGCSQQQNQPFSNKSFIAYSKKQNRSSFLSGQEKQKGFELTVGQRASDQGSNQNQQPKSYRVVESIEENRANSAYQMDIEALQKNRQLLPNNGEGSSVKVKGHHLDQLHNGGQMHNHNQGRSQEGNPAHQKISHSPRETQKASSRVIHVFHKPPVTGRTMFMNKENELLSEFIDQESELQSEVDYTYNSYDKWKDKSKVLDFGPSRFKEFDEKGEDDVQSSKKFNNIEFKYPERHGNHKQLVKSSIQGTKLLIHEFNMRENINTVQKESECNQAYNNGDQNGNKLFFETFSPENRMEINRYRKSSQYKEEPIDEDILKDLREY